MKRSLRKILCLIFVVLIIPLFSLTAWAEDFSAELNSLHFDIALQEDGSALITETREIVFSGDHEFTRYGVNNIFTGPRVFRDWQVTIDGVPLRQLDEPDNENRPENTFAVEDNDEGNTVYIYYRHSGSGTRIFQISYCVENAVKLYSDVGEFFWNLTGKTGISNIGTLTATLTVPEGIPEEDFRIWAHGPLNGTFEKQPDGSAALLIDYVPIGTIVDIRSTLPADCFDSGWEQEGEVLSDILAEEQALADSANAKREEEARQQAESEAYWAKRHAWEEEHPILYFIEQLCVYICDSVYFFLDDNLWRAVLAVVALPFVGILIICPIGRKIQNIWRKSNRNKLRYSPAQSPQYYRELPDDRPAPTVDRLVHYYDGKSDISRQLSATLLELNLKKLVDFENAAGNTTILLNEQQGEALFSSTAPQETAEPVQEHNPGYQEILWDFLLKAADGSGRVSMTDLKKYIEDNQETAYNFRNSFDSAVGKEFTERVKTTDVAKKPSGGRMRRLIVSAVAAVLAILIHIISTLYFWIDIYASLKVGLIVFVVAIIIQGIFHFIAKRIRTPHYVLDQQGEDDLALWQAFGRFLDDFTTFEDKELPEFSVWREYMVYAVAMGNGRKVAKALALKYPEVLSTGMDTYDDDIYRWLQDMALYDAMDSIGRDVAEAKAPSYSSSSSGNWSDNSWSDNSWSDSSWSDGGGSGGGFSDSGGGSDSGSGGDFID